MNLKIGGSATQFTTGPIANGDLFYDNNVGGAGNIGDDDLRSKSDNVKLS